METDSISGQLAFINSFHAVTEDYQSVYEFK